MSVAPLRAAAVACVVLAAVACARRSGAGAEWHNGEATLVVDNQDIADMTIYVVRSGSRFRVGIAPGLRRTSLRLHAGIIGGGGDIAFLADPVGSRRTPVSERIHVRPGEVIEIVIQP